MSIYATQWQLWFPVTVPCEPGEQEYEVFFFEDAPGEPGIAAKEVLIEVIAQAVPPHIGHEGGEDYYSTFLPPPVPENGDLFRAVVIVDENSRKDGQCYVNPLLVLTGHEYQTVPMGNIVEWIDYALNERYGVKPS